jgi:hypothetical protein
MKKKKFLIGVLLFLVVALPVCGYAQFSTSDLEGDWIGYDYIAAPSNTIPIGLARGNATIDSSGNFTSATYTLPDGSTISANSGSLALDANGVMSGNFLLETGDTVTVSQGKLDSGKTHAAFVDTGTGGSFCGLLGCYGLGVYFKAGGTFSQQDLVGDWYTYTFIIDPLQGLFWAYGTISVDAQGDMTGSFNTSIPGLSAPITSGTITTDTSGILSGQFALDLPDPAPDQTVPITHGKLDQSKTKGAFISINPITLTQSYAWIVKAGGQFSSQDLEDISYTYTLAYDPNSPIPLPLPVRGKYAVNDSGQLVGSFVDPTGDRIRATSGSLSLDSSGVIDGTINLDDGDTLDVANGKLDQGKTSGCVVASTPDGGLSMAMVLRVDTIEPSYAGAATNAVLANMYTNAAAAYAGQAIAGASGNYGLMQLYARSAYEFAEDAHLQAFAAIDQSTTFWGIYGEQYAASDLDNRSQALNYCDLAVQSATGGDLQTAAYYAGFCISLNATADLYNGNVIWCESMEHGVSQ